MKWDLVLTSMQASLYQTPSEAELAADISLEMSDDDARRSVVRG
jgi:hypothetical protein